MSDEFSVEISDEAKADLDRMGRLTRRLVKQALNDELRTPEPSLVKQGVKDRGWEVLPIGNYRILFHSVEPEEEGVPTRLVGHIVDEQEEDQQPAVDPPAASA